MEHKGNCAWNVTCQRSVDPEMVLIHIYIEMVSFFSFSTKNSLHFKRKKQNKMKRKIQERNMNRRKTIWGEIVCMQIQGQWWFRQNLLAPNFANLSNLWIPSIITLIFIFFHIGYTANLFNINSNYLFVFNQTSFRIVLIFYNWLCEYQNEFVLYTKFSRKIKIEKCVFVCWLAGLFEIV